MPAGEYAREALRRAGILNQVRDKIVGGVDVRATLQFVARGGREKRFNEGPQGSFRGRAVDVVHRSGYGLATQ